MFAVEALEKTFPQRRGCFRSSTFSFNKGCSATIPSLPSTYSSRVTVDSLSDGPSHRRSLVGILFRILLDCSPPVSSWGRYVSVEGVGLSLVCMSLSFIRTCLLSALLVSPSSLVPRPRVLVLVPTPLSSPFYTLHKSLQHYNTCATSTPSRPQPRLLRQCLLHHPSSITAFARPLSPPTRLHP